MLDSIYDSLGIDKLLLIVYCLFFTIPYLLSSLMFFLFGCFVKKNIRAYSVRMSRLKMPDALHLLFEFQKKDADKMLIISAIGVVCRFFSPIYFIVMEIFSFALSAIINDCVLACRISLVLFLVTTLIFIPLVIYVSTVNKKSWKNRRQNEAKKITQKHQMLDYHKPEAKIPESPTKINLDEEDKQMREMIQNQLETYRKEAEHDFITDTFDRSRRKKPHH